MDSRSFTVEAALLDDRGRTIATSKGSFSSNVVRNSSAVSGNSAFSVITFTAKAGDISDKMTVKITKIDGREAVAAGRAGYMRISAPGPVPPVPAGAVYKIGGRGPAGGYVFYDKGSYSNGWRYMEAAPGDLPHAEWGLGGTVIGGTGTAIGSGKANTELIVEELRKKGENKRAAQLCKACVLNGYADWFLPSQDELDQMYKNLYKQGLGNFSSDSDNGYYWSSSEYPNYHAWYQSFSSGSQNDNYKDNNYRVRAVRAF
jgi:hypothetical protein